MTSNAIHGYKKSHAGVGSTYTAKLETDKKYLCVNYIPNRGFRQRLADLTRRFLK